MSLKTERNPAIKRQFNWRQLRGLPVAKPPLHLSRLPCALWQQNCPLDVRISLRSLSEGQFGWIYGTNERRRRWGCCQRAVTTSCNELLLVSKLLRAFHHTGEVETSYGDGCGWWPKPLLSQNLLLQTQRNISNTMQITTGTTGLPPTWALHWISTARGETGLYEATLANVGLVDLDASGVLQFPLRYSKLRSSLLSFGIAKEQALNQKHHWNTQWKPKRRMKQGGAGGPKPGESTGAEWSLDTWTRTRGLLGRWHPESHSFSWPCGL